MSDIAAWLRQHNLEKYIDLFQQSAIEVDILDELTEDDLRELEIPLGDRKRLLKAIRGAQATTETNQASSASKPTVEIIAPSHLSDQILRSRAALEGERKQVTVLFADIEGSTRIIQDMGSERSAELLRKAVKDMMAAVHQYEGTVNKVLGDGIMAIFGAPIAHEDHAIRACYAALAMQAQFEKLSLTARKEYGVEVRLRQGLNSGDVVVRAIHNDLTMDYDAIGPTVHLASRMEQTAAAGTCRLSLSTYRLTEGFVEAEGLGLVPIKGLDEPTEVFELRRAIDIRSRFLANRRGRMTRFVGRDDETKTLERVWASAEQGRGQTLSVVGEAGVGKSRLFYEFINGPQLRDVLVLESGSVSHARASAFRPLIDLFRAYLGIEADDDVRRVREKVMGKLFALSNDLTDLATPILALLGVPSDDTSWENMDPAQRRRMTLDACRAVLIQEAELQPIVIVFEDLHWIDQETQAFLELLVENVTNTKVLLLFNYRPEYSDRWVGRANYTHIRIDPLPPVNGEEMLNDLLGSGQDLHPLRALLMERTEGYPFFIEETVQTLVEEGVLSGERGNHRLTVPIQHIQVPATIQSVIGARIDRLPPDCKQLLQTAAVIGKDFELPLLRTVVVSSSSAANDNTTTDHLNLLQTGEFIYESRMFPDPEYTFKHALTHQVAYEGLLANQRKVRHAQILGAMETLYQDDLKDRSERLIHHAALGENWEAVHRHGMEAGRRALEMSANQSALDTFEQVLVALEKLDDTPERLRDGIRTRFALRDANFVLGLSDRSETLMQEARVLAERLNDTDAMIEILNYQSGNDWAFGRSHSAAELAEEALDLAKQDDNQLLMGLANYRVASARIMIADYQEAAAAGAAGFEQLRPEATTLIRFGGLVQTFVGSFAAIALAELGRFEEALRIGSEAFKTACAAGHAYSISVSCFGIGHAALLKGDFEAAIGPLEEGLRQIEIHGVGATVPWVAGRGAYAFALAGNEEAVDSLIDMTTTEAASHYTASMMHPMAFIWLARACLELGRTRDAVRFTDLAIQGVAGADRDEGVRAWANWMKAELAIGGKGRKKAGLEKLTEAMTIAEQRGMRPLQAHCLASKSKLLNDLDLAQSAHELAVELGMHRLASKLDF